MLLNELFNLCLFENEVSWDETWEPNFVAQEGMIRKSPSGSIEQCQLIPLKLIDDNHDNDIWPNRVKHYMEKGWNILPSLIPKKDGRYWINDGHHRFHAARKLRKKAMLCWVKTRSPIDNWIDQRKKTRPRTIHI